MKIVYISPHLSTGGCPQFLLKKIQLLKDEHEVHCIEYSDHGCFTVQKNQIKERLGNKFHSVNYDKPELLNIIERIKPDVVHLEEMPEYFMDNKIATKLYNKDRKYKIIETSHDSSFDPRNKLFFPDHFTFVSQFQKEAQKSLGVLSDVIEYPITIIPRKPRSEALNVFGLDPSKKHVIHVGLFTPRKNQAEIVEYARSLINYPIQFHFIGNRADNFKYYWEPLKNNWPTNCTWWNERKDVDNFYQMADLVLFPSKDGIGDKETSPLVIREATSYNIPTLIYNSPVYMNMYDKYDNIEYLDFNDSEVNLNKILQMLNLDEHKKMKKYDIWSKWDSNEQKMFYGTNQPIDEPIVVTLREYASNGVFWSTSYDKLPSGLSFWMVPVSKHMHDYSNDEIISGIKLCIYKKDGTAIYECPYFSRFVNIPRADLSNEIPYYINYKEMFIQEKYKKFLNRKFENFIDVGANVGVVTEYFVQNELSENIIAVECDPKALKDLKKNFKREYRVKIIEKALYHENTEVSFFHSPVNPVISSLLSPDKLTNHMAGTKGNIEIKVPTVTIKDLVEMVGTIDLLKIDIEGGEYSILEKVDPSLFSKINNLFIEFHFFEENYKERYDSILNKLRNSGYMVQEYVENQATTCRGGSEIVFASKSK